MVTDVCLLALALAILYAWHTDRSALLAAHHDERTSWTDERRELLNRIKPETAVYVAPRDVVAPEQPAFDDDAAYWETRMSKEELADEIDSYEQRMASLTVVPGEATA